MNILETLLSDHGGQAIGQISQRFGLKPEDTEALVRRLVPALSGGVQRNASQPGGLESLAAALSNGKHQRYLDEPASLQEPETENDGNAILGHLFGSKDVSREVAGQAAAETGIDTGIVKKLLPIVAAAAMGALSKQTQGGAGISSGGLGGLLSGLLGGEGGDKGGLGGILSRGKDLL